MNKEIFEYVRKRRYGQDCKVGIIVARNDHGLIRIGWSQCNEEEGDIFSKEAALAWARSRMLESVEVPVHLKRAYEAMKDRALRYFKGAIPQWEYQDVLMEKTVATKSTQSLMTSLENIIETEKETLPQKNYEQKL